MEHQHHEHEHDSHSEPADVASDPHAGKHDIILTESRPSEVTNFVHFGKATYRKMRQNLIWATGYNVFAIPLAAGVLHPAFTLSPAHGAVLMSANTEIVAINGHLLKTTLSA